MINKLLKLLKIKFAGELSLKDGTMIIVEGDLAVGASVYVMSPDGKMALPDGDYELETGEILSVKDGKIEAITDVVDTTETPDIEGAPPVSEVLASVEVKLPEPEPIIVIEKVEEPIIEPIVDPNIEIKKTIEEFSSKFNQELTSLKAEVEFIKSKTLVVELKKSKDVEDKPLTRMDIIKNLKNNNK